MTRERKKNSEFSCDLEKTVFERKFEAVSLKQLVQ